MCATSKRLSRGQVRGEGAFLELDILLHVLGRHRPWEISRPSWPPVEVEAEALIFIYQKSEVHVLKSTEETDDAEMFAHTERSIPRFQ